MCRTGGRRCPSHLSDLARRARNAQRRAEYSAMKVESLDKLLDAAMVKDDTAQAHKILDQIEKHQESMELSKHEATSLKKQYLQSIAENALLSDEQGAKPDESLNGDSMESEKLKIRSAVSSLPEVFGGREYEGFSGKDLFDDTDEITSANPELGIYKTRNTGKLARLRYFNAETIRGKIVKSKLDKNSAHKDFGFRKVNPEGYEIVSFNDVGDNELYGAGIKEKIIAKTEIGDIDMDSERSVRGFTRSDFRDINGLLYDEKTMMVRTKYHSTSEHPLKVSTRSWTKARRDSATFIVP